MWLFHLAAANDKLSNLSKAPGAETKNNAPGTVEDEDELSFVNKAREMYNTVKDL